MSIPVEMATRRHWRTGLGILALGMFLLPACAFAQGRDPCDTPRGTPELSLCALQKFEQMTEHTEQRIKELQPDAWQAG